MDKAADTNYNSILILSLQKDNSHNKDSKDEQAYGYNKHSVILLIPISKEY